MSLNFRSSRLLLLSAMLTGMHCHTWISDGEGAVRVFIHAGQALYRLIVASLHPQPDMMVSDHLLHLPKTRPSSPTPHKVQSFPEGGWALCQGPLGVVVPTVGQFLRDVS